MRSDWRRGEPDSPKEGLRRIVLRVAYDGSEYSGWQRQRDNRSIQGEIERELYTLFGLYTPVYGSGRTDSGVHALDQVCHFDASTNIEAEKFRVILNTRLDKSIRVTSSYEVFGAFHARFSTYSREYWYLVKRRDDFLPFDSRHALEVERFPDLSLLNEYASLIFGTHDFTSFASSMDLSPSKCRDIYVSEWDMIKDGFGLDVLRYRVVGNAFLHRQVRSMVGTMLELGKRGIDKEEMKSILDSKDRSRALKTASPCGLYLARISYDESEYAWFEELYGKE